MEEKLASNSIESEDKDTNLLECKKEKKLFFKLFGMYIFSAFIFFIIYSLQMDEINSKNNLIKAFNENSELVCFSKIVSKSNGFKLDEIKTNFLTNGIDIYSISNCRLK